MHKGIWGELETKEQQTEQPSLPVLTKLEGKAELAVWKEVSCDAAHLFTGLQENQVILRGFYLNAHFPARCEAAAATTEKGESHACRESVFW